MSKERNITPVRWGHGATRPPLAEPVTAVAASGGRLRWAWSSYQDWKVTVGPSV